MQGLGIRGKILALAALPAICVGTALAIYHTAERVADLEASLREHGAGIVRHLAPASEHALTAGNIDELNRLSTAIMEETHVRSVVIRGARGDTLVRNGPTPLPPAETVPGLQIPTMMESQGGESLLFTADIYSSSHLSEMGWRAGPKDKPLGRVQVELSRLATISERNEILRFSLLLVAVATILVLVAGWFFSRRMMNPVLELTGAVERMQQGDLSIRVTETGADEMETLQQGFNAMAQSQQAAQSQLQNRVKQATGELRETLEALEVQNLELDQAQRKAVAANQAKSDFLAFISHEVRTPLTGVVGYCGLLFKTALNRRQRDYAGTIESSAQDVLKIINELLDVSKLESGKFELHNEDFELRECLADVLETVAPQAELKQLEIAAVADSNVPRILRGDPARLRQVLLNLVSNGVKFTTQGSVFVRVSLKEAGAGAVALRFCVTDTGTGLDPRRQARLFKAYTPADQAYDSEERGAGLGLLISKLLVGQMNGEIGVVNSPDEGAEFWFSARFSQPHARRPADELDLALAGKHVRLYAPHAYTRLALREMLAGWYVMVTEVPDFASLNGGEIATEPPADLQIVDLSKENNPQHLCDEFCGPDSPPCISLITLSTSETLEGPRNPKTSYLTKPVRPSLLRTELARMLGTNVPGKQGPQTSRESRLDAAFTPDVLVTDDDAVSRHFLLNTLESQGARVSTAMDIEQTLARLQDQTFDAIVLDMHLPDGNGTELVARLRKQPKYAKTVIVALTADAGKELHTNAWRAGFDEVLLKPVDPDVLWSAVSGSEKQPGHQAVDAAPDTSALQQDLTSLLREEIPLQRRELENAARGDDFARVASIAHTVAGGAAFCQASELREAATALHAAARTEDPSILEQSMARVHHAMDNLLSAGD